MTTSSNDTGAGGLPSDRELFAVPDDVAYFNTANLAPLLHSVREAGMRALQRRAQPWTISAQDWFTEVELLREQVGRLHGIDHDPAEGVALVPATSYGMATAAANLPVGAGTVIVVLDREYPSGIYTWRRHASQSGAQVVTVTREPGQDWTSAILATLEQWGERVAVLSTPAMHWTDGALIDLEVVVPRARALNAAVVLDLSQSLGAQPLDAAALDPDFVISVGYKSLLGPFGRAYLWVAPRHREGQPLEENWIVRVDSEDFARLVDYRDAYQPGARRFDQGQRTLFEITPMAVAATAQLLDWGVDSTANHLTRTATTILRRCAELGLEPPPGPHAPHVFGLPLPAGAGERVLNTLAAHNCYAALRDDSLRIAPHRHTTDHDIDQLTQSLTEAL